MKNLEKLINNFAFRTLVRKVGFERARAVFAKAILPMLMPAAQKQRLRALAAEHLESYFPDGEKNRGRERVDLFFDHWATKFAEDCVCINSTRIEQFTTAIEKLVSFEGEEHFVKAHRTDAGVLAVGSHVGSVSFGTTALLYHFLSLPREEYPKIRLCSEPEVARYPGVLNLLEEALGDFGGDVRFVFTHRQSKEIAIDLNQVLLNNGFVTTNLDVLFGGGSTQAFPLFERAQVYLPALVGAARMALRTGAVVLPWVCFRGLSGYRMVVEPMIGPVPRLGQDVPDDHPEMVALCEQLRATLEGWISQQPEQWVYWDRFHRRIVS